MSMQDMGSGNNPNIPDTDEPESKTQRKQRMTELQQLGEELLTLNKRQLEQIDLPDNLQSALREYQRLPNRHEAKRRQMQFIGKLMRAADHDSIRAAVERLRTPDRQEIRRGQQIEAWGERLLLGDDATVEAFLAAWPLAERQPLRQLLRNCADSGASPAGSADEAAESVTPAARKARRRLYDYLGDVIG